MNKAWISIDKQRPAEHRYIYITDSTQTKIGVAYTGIASNPKDYEKLVDYYIKSAK